MKFRAGSNESSDDQLQFLIESNVQFRIESLEFRKNELLSKYYFINLFIRIEWAARAITTVDG